MRSNKIPILAICNKVMSFIRIKYELILVLLFGTMGCIISLNAQETDESPGFLAFGATYGIDLPMGDLSDRFGLNFHAGMSLSVWNPKLNGFWGIEGDFHFGDRVNEDVLSSVKTNLGTILGSNGEVSEVFLRRRGSYLGVFVNKVILPLRSDPISGLQAGFGLGILQHHIHILDETSNAGHFRNDYLKGYDRNTRGFALKQTLKFQKVSKPDANMNYSIGFVVTEGFTKSVRSVNFDTGMVNEGNRLDILFALEATWFLPIRRFRDADEIFY